MPRFGVFFVPPARSPFYRLGTSIIGYDARRGEPAHADNFIRAQLPNFDEEFVRRPYKHGIHCTVVAPQECRQGDLASINYDIERCLNCFSNDAVFEIIASTPLIEFWGKKQQIVVLKFAPNPLFLALHTLLVSQLSTYVIPNPERSQQEALHEFHRVQHFNYPFVFDGFTPHFTLMFPYKDNQHKQLEQVLYGLFGQFKRLLVDSLCLMTQEDKDAHWQIHTEYHFTDFPQTPED